MLWLRRTRLRPAVLLTATTEAELDSVVSGIDRSRVGALLVNSDPFFNNNRDMIVTLAANKAIPAIYEWREFALAGGLMSYGARLPDMYRLVGVYAGRILKGEKPADMPIQQPTKFEFVINLKTAKTLGLAFPSGLLSIADEVIERGAPVHTPGSECGGGLRRWWSSSPPSLPVVRYVNGASATVVKDLVTAFRQGLSGAGCIEGQNVTVEYRWAEGHYDRLPAMVSELVGFMCMSWSQIPSRWFRQWLRPR